MGRKEVEEVCERLGTSNYGTFYGVACSCGYGVYNDFNKLKKDIKGKGWTKYKKYTRANKAENYAILEFNRMQDMNNICMPLKLNKLNKLSMKPVFTHIN